MTGPETAARPAAGDVVAIGELLVDFACRDTDAAGYPLLQANPGGAPANVLAAVAACGLRACLIAKVGDDAFGRLLVASLARAGVSAAGVVTDPDVFTTLAFVTIDGEGERAFSFARKPGADVRLRPDEVDGGLIDGARLLHFGSVSMTDEPARAATRAAVARAKRAGAYVSFDPNLRPPLWRDPAAARREIEWGLTQADVVKLSGEEAAFLFGDGAPETAANRLIDAYGVSLAAVTLGADGCLLRTPTAVVRAAAPAVRPVDTTGAGDIFCGYLLARLLTAGVAPAALDEERLAAIARAATVAASLSTERPGGLSAVPAEAEVLSRL